MTRHNLRFVAASFALLLPGIVPAADAGIPPMEVTVVDASRNVAFKGRTSADGTFATTHLQPGHYVVQFNAKSASSTRDQFLVVISAGKKKVVATGVSGETFSGGGAAMKVNLERGLQITGQLASEQRLPSEVGANYRVVGGQRFVWVTAQLGSNLGGHWVEAGAAPSVNVTRLGIEVIRRIQDRAGEGSMISYSDHHYENHEGY